MKQKCKHQFFEIKKIVKESPAVREHNLLEAQKTRSIYEYPLFLWREPDVFGVRVKCALCNLQKDIYETKGKSK